LLEQRRQFAKRAQADAWGSGQLKSAGTGRPLEHPRRNLKPAVRMAAVRRAAEVHAVALRHHAVNANHKPKPRMVRIENFP